MPYPSLMCPGFNLIAEHVVLRIQGGNFFQKSDVSIYLTRRGFPWGQGLACFSLLPSLGASPAPDPSQYPQQRQIPAIAFEVPEACFLKPPQHSRHRQLTLGVFEMDVCGFAGKKRHYSCGGCCPLWNEFKSWNWLFAWISQHEISL